MRNNSVKYIFIALAILINSCKKEKRLDLPGFPLNEAILTSTNVLNYSSKLAHIEYKIFVPDPQKILGTENQGVECLNDSSALFYNTFSYVYTIDSSKYESAEQSGPYSALLLIDKSESSGNNHLFEGLNFFTQNIGTDNEFAVSGFARGGQLEQDVFTVYGNGFTNDYEESKVDLLELVNKTGGTSSYYDALDRAIDYVINNASKQNRYIVSILGNLDDGNSTAILDSLIEKARNNQIKICMLHNPDRNLDFAKLTTSTGGFCGAGMSPQLTLFSLNRLLEGNYNQHCFYVKLQKTNKPYAFYPGRSYSHEFDIGHYSRREEQPVVHDGYSSMWGYDYIQLLAVRFKFYLAFE